MSENTVFYAWQSDLPEKGNHYFIRDAAKLAIQALAAELAVDEAPRLDHDTKDVPGLPDIVQTILRKIEACSIFVADVSLVGRTAAAVGKAKLLPNPNVMIELGYALKTVGAERIILVMNTAFGGPEELPFDLRTRRHPIQYALASADDPDRKAILTGLTNSLKSAIRAIIDNAPDIERPAAEALAHRSAEETRMKEVRARFVDDALRGRFHKFEPERGAILVTLLPESRRSLRLNFGGPAAQQVRLRTVHVGPRPVQLYGRMAVVSDTYPGGKVVAATQLNDDGSILAADGYLLSSAPTAKMKERYGGAVTGYVPSQAYEEELARSIGEYAQTMRALGVRGPIDVSISLFRVQGFIMGAETWGMLMGHDVRVYSGDGIHPDPVVVAEDTPLKTVGDAARLLKPAFDYIWREFGYAGSMNFDDKGIWKRE